MEQRVAVVPGVLHEERSDDHRGKGDARDQPPPCSGTRPTRMTLIPINAMPSSHRTPSATAARSGSHLEWRGVRPIAAARTMSDAPSRFAALA